MYKPLRSRSWQPLLGLDLLYIFKNFVRWQSHFHICNNIFISCDSNKKKCKQQWCSGVMVNMLALSAIDHRFKTWWGHTKDYEICICCFSVKHAALMRKRKDLMAWKHQDNVSVWSVMWTTNCCFNKLVQYNSN